MKKIAFVTSTVNPEIASDDKILAQAFLNRGIECIAAPWDDNTIDWTSFDLVLIRSCWNYHLVSDLFENWIKAMQALGVRIFNQPELVLWNINKRYLAELQSKGVAIPETTWVSEHDFYEDQFADILSTRRWNRAVLKPTVSASSFRTNIVTKHTAKEEGRNFINAKANADMMLQEFVEAIPKQGELSIIFFNGNFSHAVIKQAMPGDFRVQNQFGGVSTSIAVDKEIIHAAEFILDTLPMKPLYARVDGVDIKGVFHLMELELIEPVLFFNHEVSAATRFVDELLKVVG